MEAAEAALLQKLTELHLSVFEEQLKTFHEQVENYISVAGVHPITHERATSVCSEPSTNWTTYSRTSPGASPSDAVDEILRKTCLGDLYFASKGLMEVAFKEAARAEFNVSEKTQFAFILLRTLDKRKETKRENLRGVRGVYDEHISLLLDWIRQSAPYLHVDSREQNLVQLLLHIVTQHPPTKQATQEHVTATLRDLQAQAKEAAAAPGTTTVRVTADGTDELQEILKHVAFRRKETKNYPVYTTVFRANGGTFCQKKSQLECAQAILKRMQSDGFNWRHKLVLNFDRDHLDNTAASDNT